MIEFFLTLAILLLLVAGMAVGVIAGRKPISGSCGGLNNAGVGGACELCGGDMSKCEENADDSESLTSLVKKSTVKKAAGFYDAGR